MNDEPRFKPLPLDQLTAAQAQLRTALIGSKRGTVRGPFIPLMYSPELADRIRHLGDYVRFEGVLPAKLKEIVILATGRHWSADYMFAVHREMSAATGLDRSVVDAIAAGDYPAGLTPPEQAAYDFTVELLRTGRVADHGFAAARSHFGEQGVVELLGLVGFYAALALLLNASRVPLPEGGEKLPVIAR
jgi:4-carboxymuconolactone decarboxylase